MPLIRLKGVRAGFDDVENQTFHEVVSCNWLTVICRPPPVASTFTPASVRVVAV